MQIDHRSVYADEVDDMVLEQSGLPKRRVKEAQLWQEALDMPNKLELGILEDPFVKSGKRLVLQVPSADRSKTRNCFRAILPRNWNC